VHLQRFTTASMTFKGITVTENHSIGKKWNARKPNGISVFKDVIFSYTNLNGISRGNLWQK